MTIQDVQSDSMLPDTAVELEGVVVVAVDTYAEREGGTGRFFVMEPGGGPYSGVLVFGGSVDQVAELSPGDLINLGGVMKDEFSLKEDSATVTELVPLSDGSMTLEEIGHVDVPDPEVVDALAFGSLSESERDEEYEKWEGVLIQVNSVSVISNPRVISDNPDFIGFGITGPYEVDSGLAEIPNDHVMRGDCLASVTGIGDYFFQYKIVPRTTTDIVKDGTGCPGEEDDVTECGDELDNDADGFADCMDFSCQDLPECQTSTTIVDIQNGTIAEGSIVNLNDVVVTAVSWNRKSLWVADAATGAAYNGVYVYRGNAAAELDVSIVPGAVVDVNGSVDEFNSGGGTGTNTQISGNPTVTFVSAGAGTPTPTFQPFATLSADAGGEMYEGVLVEVRDVQVISAATSFNTRNFAAQGSSVVLFESDDDISSALNTAAVNTCYASIKGIWSYQVYDDRWSILPLADGATTEPCP